MRLLGRDMLPLTRAVAAMKPRENRRFDARQRLAARRRTSCADTAGLVGTRLLLLALTLFVSGCGGRTDIGLTSPVFHGGDTPTAPATGTTPSTTTYPASCVISASNYDQSCALDSDCVIVPLGNVCMVGAFECGDSISFAALEQYNANLAKTPLAAGGVGIGCTAAALPCCRQGHCKTSCPSTGGGEVLISDQAGLSCDAGSQCVLPCPVVAAPCCSARGVCQCGGC